MQINSWGSFQDWSPPLKNISCKTININMRNDLDWEILNKGISIFVNRGILLISIENEFTKNIKIKKVKNGESFYLGKNINHKYSAGSGDVSFIEVVS